MTFDLHYPDDVKAEAYKNWIRRIYSVSSILHISYSELWDLPEQEFLVLEEIALQTMKKQEDATSIQTGGK